MYIFFLEVTYGARNFQELTHFFIETLPLEPGKIDSNTNTYLEPSRTFTMELFCKTG